MTDQQSTEDRRLEAERVQLEAEAESIFGRKVTLGLPATVFDPKAYLPRVIGADWQEMPPWRGLLWFLRRGLKVMISCSEELDGNKWLHVSLSRENMIPTYDDIQLVKTQFIGADKTALQVFPPAAKHINLNPHVLHLWCCLDRDVTPDFTRGGESL